MNREEIAKKIKLDECICGSCECRNYCKDDTCSVVDFVFLEIAAAEKRARSLLIDYFINCVKHEPLAKLSESINHYRIGLLNTLDKMKEFSANSENGK